MALDEFALQSVPNTGYAWAPKNTAPTVPSDERHRHRLNGSLTVDVRRGTTDATFRSHCKTDDAVFVVVMTVLRYVQKGYHGLTVILDNARTHRQDMQVAAQAVLMEIAEQCGWEDLKRTTVEFLHTPPYSPAFNPAEYLIHWVRQHALYHLPCAFTLQDKASRVQQHLAQGPPLSPQQMDRLLHHIHTLPHGGKAVKWPKLE